MGHLDDLLPIRRILVDGEALPFATDLDISTEALSASYSSSAGSVTINAASGATPRTFSSTVDLTLRSYFQVFDLEGQDCVLGLSATEGFKPGVSVETYIPPLTATDLLIADNLDPNGDREPFDATKGYYAIATAVAENAVRFSGFVIPELVTDVPTVVSAEVATDQLDRVTLNMSEGSQFPTVGGVTSLSGISLGGTMAVARTITGVHAGNGTSAITLQLSGALSISDAPTVVRTSACTLRALNGTPPAAGSTSIAFVSPVYDWTLETSDTLFMRANTPSFGVANNAAIPTWTAINPPNAYTASEATNRPVYHASEANGYPAAAFDGTNDKLSFDSMTTANLFGSASSAFYLDATIQVNAVASTAGDTAGSNDSIICTPFWGLQLTHQGGTYRAVAHIYDTVGYKIASAVIGASLPAGGEMVVGMRVSGGSLYAHVNGAEGAGTAIVGNLNSAADAGKPDIGKSNSGQYFNGSIFELRAKSNGAFPTTAVATNVSVYT